MIKTEKEEPIFFHGIRLIFDDEIPFGQRIIWPERCYCAKCSEYLKRKMEGTE